MRAIIVATIVPTVVSYVVSDLASDKGATEGVQSFRVSFKVDATPEAVDRLLTSLRKTGVPADALKLVNLSENDGKPAGSGKGSQSAVRVWARENGYTVGDRGVIAQSIIDAHAAATS